MLQKDGISGGQEGLPHLAPRLELPPKHGVHGFPVVAVVAELEVVPLPALQHPLQLEGFITRALLELVEVPAPHPVD